MNPVHWPTWLIVVAGLGVGAVAGTGVWFKMRNGLGGEVASGIITALATAGLAIAIPMSIRADDDYRRWCQAQGGHVDTHSDTQAVTTVDNTGKVGIGTSTSTTYYCLTADGRIIDIQ